ncbi:helix-turn-helix domain-containing protein [Bradyrhizobium sp. OAE829]|uniref:helix-turn-helix domain-containing protein n=1 Tax=Bradyrhizobium sp. OAE829 TaxID=2663807 RepID=UPI00339806F3
MGDARPFYVLVHAHESINASLCHAGMLRRPTASEPQAVSSVSISGSACRNGSPHGACSRMVKTVGDLPVNPLLSEAPRPELKPLTVTVATACTLTGLGNTTVWGLVRDRRLETVRIGRRTLITFRSLEALVAPLSEPDRQPHRRGRPRKVIGGVRS